MCPGPNMPPPMMRPPVPGQFPRYGNFPQGANPMIRPQMPGLTGPPPMMRPTAGGLMVPPPGV